MVTTVKVKLNPERSFNSSSSKIKKKYIEHRNHSLLWRVLGMFVAWEWRRKKLIIWRPKRRIASASQIYMQTIVYLQQSCPVTTVTNTPINASSCTCLCCSEASWRTVYFIKARLHLTTMKRCASYESLLPESKTIFISRRVTLATRQREAPSG
jgi:hypothetical protein